MKFIDREVEYPNRIRLKEVRKEQNGDVIYDLLREEGAITTAGTPLNAENLNALVKTIKVMGAADIIDVIYPIGRVIMTEDSANPETYWEGTTWQAWGQGRMPLGIGANIANTVTTYGSLSANAINRTAAGELGGVNKQAGNQVGSHSHQYSLGNSSGQAIYAQYSYSVYNTSGQTNTNDLPQPMLPAYQTIYFWKRVS